MSAEGDWIKVKGQELHLKVIETKSQEDQGAHGGKEIKPGDTVLVNLIGRQADNPEKIMAQSFKKLQIGSLQSGRVVLYEL